MVPGVFAGEDAGNPEIGQITIMIGGLFTKLVFVSETGARLICAWVMEFGAT
jgi:hypothetical protein